MNALVSVREWRNWQTRKTKSLVMCCAGFRSFSLVYGVVDPVPLFAPLGRLNDG